MRKVSLDKAIIRERRGIVIPRCFTYFSYLPEYAEVAYIFVHGMVHKLYANT